jgi:tetratricopeptide (TPR) repeat protein
MLPSLPASIHTSATNELLRQGPHRAGDFLEERAWHAVGWDDGVEAAYHLGEVGEAAREFDLLLSPAEWLQRRGRNLDTLAVLDMLKAREALNPQNQGRFLVIRGQAYVGLGNLPRAIAEIRQAVEILQQLAQQDPSNTQWQRDLSISHDKIGDMLAAQGNGAEALVAYQRSLAIRERLAQQDPTNAEWQTDLVVSYWKLA